MDKAMSPLRQDEKQFNRTILLVEDHFVTRWSAAEYLRRVGFRVVEAVNAAEAVGVISCGTEVDLVFTDVIMPGGDDGYTLARWLSKQRPHLPVVLTSSAPRSPEAPEDGPLRRFVQKPYELSGIEQLLKSMLA